MDVGVTLMTTMLDNARTAGVMTLVAVLPFVFVNVMLDPAPRDAVDMSMTYVPAAAGNVMMTPAAGASAPVVDERGEPRLRRGDGDGRAHAAQRVRDAVEQEASRTDSEDLGGAADAQRDEPGAARVGGVEDRRIAVGRDGVVGRRGVHIAREEPKQGRRTRHRLCGPHEAIGVGEADDPRAVEHRRRGAVVAEDEVGGGRRHVSVEA